MGVTSKLESKIELELPVVNKFRTFYRTFLMLVYFSRIYQGAGGMDAVREVADRIIDNIEKVMSETAAWQSHRNNKNAKVNWQFTTDDSRIKLSRLYPSIEI